MGRLSEYSEEEQKKLRGSDEEDSYDLLPSARCINCGNRIDDEEVYCYGCYLILLEEGFFEI
jgi:hypothetical protein